MKKTYHFKIYESIVRWGDVTVDLEEEGLLDENGNIDKDALDERLENACYEEYTHEETVSSECNWEEI